MRFRLIFIGFCLFILLVFMQGASAALPAWVKNSQSEIKLPQVSSAYQSSSSLWVSNTVTYQSDDSFDNAYNRALWQRSANYEASLTEAQKKIDPQIRELIDPRYPRTLDSSTVDGLRAVYINKGILIPAEKLENGIGDVLCVYIWLNDGVSLDIADPLCYKIVFRNEQFRKVDAMVPIKNIENLASLSGVRIISLVLPPSANNPLSQVRTSGQSSTRLTYNSLDII